MEDDEIVVLFNQFHFFMVVNQICNVTPAISWGFVDYEEDVAAPLIEDYLWLTTNYNSNNYNITFLFNTRSVLFVINKLLHGFTFCLSIGNLFRGRQNSNHLRLLYPSWYSRHISGFHKVGKCIVRHREI